MLICFRYNISANFVWFNGFRKFNTQRGIYGIVILCISGAMPSFVDISVTSSEESEKRVPKFSFALDASKVTSEVWAVFTVTFGFITT